MFSLEIAIASALFCLIRSAACRARLTVAASLALASSLAALMAVAFLLVLRRRCPAFAVAAAYVVGAGSTKRTVFFLSRLDAFPTLARVPVRVRDGFSVDLVSLGGIEGFWWIVGESRPGGVLADCGSTLEGVAATGARGMVACGSVDCGSTLESGACTCFKADCGFTRDWGDST